MKRHSHAVWCVIAVASTSLAEVINVPADQPTIQAGIDAASDGDVVEVAPGTYLETIDFIGKAITLRSSHGRDVTTIDAQEAGSVVTCASGEGPDTVLEGFTITGGSAIAASDGGGGMLNSGSSPTVIDCTFIGNTADSSSGEVGGGMANFNSSPTVTSCAFISNSAELGGGMGNFYSSSPTVTNCRFSGNMAESGGGMLNFALSFGSNPTVTNCTFIGNAAAEGGGMFNSSGSSPIVANCILWGNTAPIDAQINNGAVTYSNVQGGYFGDSNIDADPMFVDPENGNLHLAGASPCIDAANNTAVPRGVTTDLDGNPRFAHDPCTVNTGHPDGTNPPVDMGAYEFQPPCPADLDCNGRVGVVEFLAIISAWDSCEDCPEDLNGDNTVAVGDFLTVLMAWGPCS